MAGSLKATCAVNTRAWVQTAPFGSLNAQTKFTVSCWLEVASLGSGAVNGDIAAAVTNYPFTFGIANRNSLSFQAHNFDNSKNLTYLSQMALGQGHFVVLSYDATGTTTLYLDGSAAATATALGATTAANQVVNVGFNATGAPVTTYTKDLAIWSGYSATPQDVLDLRDGTHTPATLGTPATNWWTCQGPVGAVTGGTQGLADQIGGVPLATIVTDSPATLTYDAHEITLSGSASMMAPFLDVTGNLIVIPLYLNPLVTTGGPGTPSSINIAPIFKKNGSVITPTLVPLYNQLYAIVYQMPSPALATDVVTMSAGLGWASTTAGIVTGTGSGGTPAAPLTVTNNVGLAVENIYNVAKTMKAGYNVAAFAGADNAPGQPTANWARKVEANADGWSNALTYHPNGLPATISGLATGVLFYTQNNMVDSNGTPSIEGLYTLVYGDSSTGVTSGAPNQIVELSFNPSWSVTRTVTSPGTWNGSAWTGITKTYQTAYAPSGGNTGYSSALTITITSGNGNVDFPSKGNGQVELGVFPPSPSNRNVSSPTSWDPLGIDPEYLLKLAGASAVRYMPDLAGFQFDGDSSMKTIGDLAQRQVNDFLWTSNATTTVNVISAAPIGATFSAFMDYQGTNQTMSASNWNAAGLYTRVPMLLTTDAPHGLRSGDYLTITNLANVPQLVIKQDNLLLTSGIAATGSPVTFTTDSPAPMLVGDVIRIGTEQMTVTTVLNTLTVGTVTVTRPTAGTPLAAHNIGDVVYTNFLTAAITTIGQTVITVTRTGYPYNYLGTFQIDSEQMTVVSTGSATSATVTRGVNGTTAATHAVGALVYPVINLDTRNTKVSPMVVDSTHFVIAINHNLLPVNFATAVSNPTLNGTTTFTAPNAPTCAVQKPSNHGSVPYEFAAKTTNAIAVANGYPTTLWINVSVMATDALVTEIIANRIIPYLTSTNVHLVVEIGNEIWNGAGTVYLTAALLAITAPNPDTPSAPFTNSQQWVASRQNHVNKLAQAAFTAASLDPARVYNFQPGQHQINPVQGTSQAAVAYCQTHSIPIDLLTIDGYVDITTVVWNLWWSWMPTADGGSASWTRAMARRVMMSYFRAWCWFSAYFGGGILGNAQLLSWYKAGKLVSANGVGTGTANTGLGKLCYYESATEFITAGAGSFVHPDAATNDLIYDGHPEWAGDLGWKATETAYIASKQGAAAMYAALMPAASFPDLTAATAAFTCIFASTYVPGSQGQMWFTYNWQGQQPGSGAANTMSVPAGTTWTGATPVSQARVNQSVRAQAAIDWIAATGGAYAASMSRQEALDLLAAGANFVGLPSAATMSRQEALDLLVAIGLIASPSAATMSKQEAHDLLAAIARFAGPSIGSLVARSRDDHPTGRARGGSKVVGARAKKWFPGMRGVKTVLKAGQ